MRNNNTLLDLRQQSKRRKREKRKIRARLRSIYEQTGNSFSKIKPFYKMKSNPNFRDFHSVEEAGNDILSTCERIGFLGCSLNSRLRDKEQKMIFLAVIDLIQSRQFKSSNSQRGLLEDEKYKDYFVLTNDEIRKKAMYFADIEPGFEKRKNLAFCDLTIQKILMRMGLHGIVDYIVVTKNVNGRPRANRYIVLSRQLMRLMNALHIRKFTFKQNPSQLFEHAFTLEQELREKPEYILQLFLSKESMNESDAKEAFSNIKRAYRHVKSQLCMYGKVQEELLNSYRREIGTYVEQSRPPP